MDIPKPPSSGSFGAQQLEDLSTTSLEPYTPLSGLPLAQRVEGIAATRPRNFGGEVAATLLAGTFSQMSEDLRIQRELTAEASNRASRLQTELGTCLTNSAVLEERIASHARTQTIKQVSIFAGTALLAVAIDLLKADLKALAGIIAILGVALLGFGWTTGQEGNHK